MADAAGLVEESREHAFGPVRLVLEEERVAEAHAPEPAVLEPSRGLGETDGVGPVFHGQIDEREEQPLPRRCGVVGGGRPARGSDATTPQAQGRSEQWERGGDVGHRRARSLHRHGLT